MEAAAATVMFTGQILIIVACAGVFAWLGLIAYVPDISLIGVRILLAKG